MVYCRLSSAADLCCMLRPGQLVAPILNDRAIRKMMAEYKYAGFMAS